MILSDLLKLVQVTDSKPELKYWQGDREKEIYLKAYLRM